MKKAFKSIIVISIFAVLSISCSTKLDVKDLTGFWQGESGRGFQFTDKGTYFFYFIENGTWKCSGDSENNFYVNGNKIRCEWTENGEIKAICYVVDSFSEQKMKLRSGSGDISDGKYIKVSEPSHIDVEDRKSALASSILAQIDEWATEYIEISDKCFRIRTINITPQEKTIKPDFLLPLSVANNLVAKSQKINALAIYIVDYSVRMLYDMPLSETKEVIAKLAAEINCPLDVEEFLGDLTLSEKLKHLYNECKENGETAFFWSFQNAILVEMSYFISINPDLVLNSITEEQFTSFRNRILKLLDVAYALAEYDEEIADIVKFREKYSTLNRNMDWDNIETSLEYTKRTYIETKEIHSARRNALLQ